MRPTRGHSNVCHQAIGNRKVLQRSSAKIIFSLLKQKESEHPRNQNGWWRREVVRAFPKTLLLKIIAGIIEALKGSADPFPPNPKSFQTMIRVVQTWHSGRSDLFSFSSACGLKLCFLLCTLYGNDFSLQLPDGRASASSI